MRFIIQNGQTFRVGIRDGWLIVSQHIAGRLRAGKPVREVGEISIDDLVRMIEKGKIDLAKEIEKSVLNQIFLV
jgi:hypothetical protein